MPSSQDGEISYQSRLPPDLDFKCRICGAKSAIRLLFQSESRQTVHMLTTVASISVAPNDALPKCICKDCLLQLTNAYNFKLLCEKSDREHRRRLGLSDKPVPPLNVRAREEEEESRNELTSLYQCRRCKLCFSQALKFQRHFETHKPFPCEICGEEFANFNVLRTHEKFHFVCSTCGWNSTNMDAHLRHIRSHDPSAPVSETFIGPPPPPLVPTGTPSTTSTSAQPKILENLLQMPRQVPSFGSNQTPVTPNPKFVASNQAFVTANKTALPSNSTAVPPNSTIVVQNSTFVPTISTSNPGFGTSKPNFVASNPNMAAQKQAFVGSTQTGTIKVTFPTHVLSSIPGKITARLPVVIKAPNGTPVSAPTLVTVAPKRKSSTVQKQPEIKKMNTISRSSTAVTTTASDVVTQSFITAKNTMPTKRLVKRFRCNVCGLFFLLLKELNAHQIKHLNNKTASKATKVIIAKKAHSLQAKLNELCSQNDQTGSTGNLSCIPGGSEFSITKPTTQGVSDAANENGLSSDFALIDEFKVETLYDENEYNASHGYDVIESEMNDNIEIKSEVDELSNDAHSDDNQATAMNCDSTCDTISTLSAHEGNLNQEKVPPLVGLAGDTEFESELLSLCETLPDI